MKIEIALAVLLGLSVHHAQPQTTSPLTLQRTIALPAGTGKFDHFAVDLRANRLFIAATGNHTIEVVDLNTDEVVQTIDGLGKPHGLAWIPETGHLYAADGAQGDLKIFAGSPLKLTKSIKLSEDADDMVYDARTRLLYVGHGGGDTPAQVAVIDTTEQSLKAELPVKTHPESLEIDNARDRIFVNVAESAEVAVIDGATHSLAAPWKVTRAANNVPLTFAYPHNLLFVACRKPARLVVFDGESGREISDLPSDQGADDLFYDAELQRVYLIAGAGSLDTYQLEAGNTLHALPVTPTSAGAKTGLFVPSQHALYVGVIAIAGKEAEIRVYATR